MGLDGPKINLSVHYRQACDLLSFDYWSIQEVALVYCQLDLIKALTPADPADPHLSEV